MYEKELLKNLTPEDIREFVLRIETTKNQLRDCLQHLSGLAFQRYSQSQKEIDEEYEAYKKSQEEQE